MNSTEKVISRNLKQLRKKSGMTQEELSIKSGISRSYIANIECGRRHSMSVTTLLHLSEKLNVTIYDLLEGIE